MTSWSSQDLRVNGVSLKQYAFGVAGLNAVDSLPPRRGTNQEIAYWRGQRWQTKQWDSVTRSLVMWVDGREADGSYADTLAGRIARKNANIRTLMSLFATEQAPLDVERDVLLPTGQQTWTGQAEVSGAMQFESSEEWSDIAAVGVDLVFADPFWYGPSTAASVTRGASVTITNPGEVMAVVQTVTFRGPLQQPRLVNGSFDPEVWLKIGTDIASGDSVTVVWETSAVVRSSDGANLVGALQNSGSREWMLLQRGSNVLTIDSPSGTGHAELTFRPPRL